MKKILIILALLIALGLSTCAVVKVQVGDNDKEFNPDLIEIHKDSIK